jgi:hypothetical protein
MNLDFIMRRYWQYCAGVHLYNDVMVRLEDEAEQGYLWDTRHRVHVIDSLAEKRGKPIGTHGSVATETTSSNTKCSKDVEYFSSGIEIMDHVYLSYQKEIANHVIS